MKSTTRISRAIWLLTGLAMLTSSAWGQTTPPIQNGQVDGLRLAGANDRDGNQASNRKGRGGSDNSGPGSANSGQGSGNSGPGSVNSGSGHGGSDNSGPGSANSGQGSGNSGPGSVNSGSGRGGENSGRSGQDDIRNVNDNRREDRQQGGQVDRRSNSGGELRGLDRASQVAGDHGQQGRDHARDVQMERANRPDRLDHQQRPEHPDRPQRPDRSERHDRSGHN